MTTKIDRRTRVVLSSLGDHVRAVRESLGMSQAELARAIGMEATNLAKIERGARNVTIDTLVRIADGLGAALSVRMKLRAAK